MNNEEVKKESETEEVIETITDLNEETETELSLEEALTKENEALKKEVAKLKNDYALAYADTSNMRKRLTNEVEQMKKYRIQSFALEILPALDNLERALAIPKEDDSYYQGVKMIYEQLITSLKNEGLSEVEALNQKFDSNFMQSLSVEKVDGVEEGIVIEVFQKGYKLKDRILRPALVKVAE